MAVIKNKTNCVLCNRFSCAKSWILFMEAAAASFNAHEIWPLFNPQRAHVYWLRHLLLCISSRRLLSFRTNGVRRRGQIAHCFRGVSLSGRKLSPCIIASQKQSARTKTNLVSSEAFKIHDSRVDRLFTYGTKLKRKLKYSSSSSFRGNFRECLQII